MKSECGRFEYEPEIGIYDSLSKRYVSLDGEIKQIQGTQQIAFSEATKELLNNFIGQLKPVVSQLDVKNKQERIKSNFFIEFNKNLNEGYSD